MTLKHQVLTFAAIISVSFAANAEEVYENVNKEGVVEFSDQPSVGAHIKEAQSPNVADAIPTSSTDSVSSTSAVKVQETPAEIEKQEVIRQGVADNHIDRHEKREKIKKHIKKNDSVVAKPIRKNVNRQ